jgi:arsenate reductase
LKRILFACVGNSFRSQIAEGFALAHVRPGAAEIQSGGTQPFGFVSPKAVRLMKDRGIDISRHTSKPLDLAFASQAEAFVSLCGPLDDSCPRAIAKKVLQWDIGDPSGTDPDEQRRMRDDIEARVVALLREHGIAKDVAP